LPADAALAALDAKNAPPPATAPPLATALHENKPPAVPPDQPPLTPALRPPPDPLLSPPPKQEIEERFGGTALEPAPQVDHRAAVKPNPLDLPSFTIAEHSPGFGAPTASAAPRANLPGPVAPPVAVNQAPADQLLAALWRHVGGPTLFDQAKAVLAMIGVVALVIAFLRFGTQKEREHEEE
jgi:hypothetical protein